MLLSAMSVLVVAQSSSEIPEGLMNNPVYLTAIGWTPGGSSTVHIYKQKGHRTTQSKKQCIEQHNSRIRKNSSLIGNVLRCAVIVIN